MSEDSHPTVRRGSQASPEPGFQPAIDLTRLDATSSGQAKQPAGSTVDIQQARLDNDDFIGEIPGKILGDFELLREIGRGGMGVVYEAKQLSLGKRVALKILPASAMLDARAVKRFQNEAWATAQLQHRHIVPVNQIGSERGIHFLSKG